MSSQPFWPVFVGSHRVLHKEPFGHPKISDFLSDEKTAVATEKNYKISANTQVHNFLRFVEIRGDSWRFVGIRGDSWRFVEIRGDSWDIRGDSWDIRGDSWAVHMRSIQHSWRFVGFRGVSWALISEIVATVLYKIPRKFSTKTDFLQQ